MTERSATCPSCGAGIHSDKKWTKCECGARVWLDEELRRKYGGDSLPRAFRPEPHEQERSNGDSDDETGRNATLDEF